MIISIIIMLVVTSVIGGGVYLAFSASETLNTQFAIKQQSERAEKAKEYVIKASSRSATGDFLVPAGDASGSYNQLPADLGINRFAASGDAFLYCPVGSTGDATTATQAITLPDATTYDVSTATIGGKTMVIGATLTSSAVALIVAPLPNRSSTPSCGDVVETAGSYFVEKGQVWPITKEDILTDNIISAKSEMTFYVSPTGAGDNSLESVLTQVKSGQVSSGVIRIHAESGTYSITDNAVVQMGDALQGKTLIIEAEGAPAVIQAQDTSVLAMSLAHGAAHFINAEINADLSMTAGDLVLSNTGINSLQTTSSNTTLDDARIYEDSNMSALLSGGTSRILGSLQSNGALVVSGGEDLTAKGASVQIASTSNGAISVLGGSSLSAKSSTISLDNSGTVDSVIVNRFGHITLDDTQVSMSGTLTDAVYNRGDLVIDGSAITLAGSSTTGIYKAMGSSTVIENSTLFTTGSLPITGVMASDTASEAQGNNSNISASMSCWDGGMLATTDGVTSNNTTTDFSNVNNNSSWTCI